VQVSSSSLRRPQRVRTRFAAVLLGLAGLASLTPAAFGDSADKAASAAALTMSARASTLCALRPSVSAPKADDFQRASAILQGRLQLPGTPALAIGAFPTWREGQHIASFQSALHGLAWVDVLRRTWIETGDHRFLARYERVLRSWANVAKDGRGSVTKWVWFDMAQGQRAAEFTCAIAALGPRPWLLQAARQGLEILKDRKASRYDGEGNHSLWQDTGLWSLSKLFDDQPGQRLAVSRLQALLAGAVSADGESVEGSSVYQELNWLWWREAVQLIRPAQLAGGSRVELMAQVYSDLISPSAHLMAFGDAQTERPALRDLVIPSPRSLSVMPELGVAQARDSNNSSMVLLRIGAAGTRQLHGHRDAGSVQFHACGRTLLGDGGMFAYAPSTPIGQRARRFVKSAAAHSVVLPFGSSADFSQRTRVTVLDREDGVYFKAEIPLNTGEIWLRRVYYSRVHGFLLIEDQLRGGGSQLWQLPRDSRFVIDGPRIIEESATNGCALSLVWVAGARPNVVYGASGMGWMSEVFGALTPRPTAIATVAEGRPAAILIAATPVADGAEFRSITALGGHRYAVSGDGEVTVDFNVVE
jgi:hypothetical protein